MCWQCEYCKREFSKPYALTQHISQRHPYIQNDTTQIASNEQLDDSIWQLPDYNDYSSSYEYSTDYEVIYRFFYRYNYY